MVKSTQSPLGENSGCLRKLLEREFKLNFISPSQLVEKILYTPQITLYCTKKQRLAVQSGIWLAEFLVQFPSFPVQTSREDNLSEGIWWVSQAMIHILIARIKEYCSTPNKTNESGIQMYLVTQPHPS